MPTVNRIDVKFKELKKGAYGYYHKLPGNTILDGIGIFNTITHDTIKISSLTGHYTKTFTY